MRTSAMERRGVTSGKVTAGDGAAARQALLALLLLISLLLFTASPATAAVAGAADEVAIMRRLRQAAHDADPAWTAGFDGWQPGDPAHPCFWQNVLCDDSRRVIRVNLWDGGESAKGNSSTPAAQAPANVSASGTATAVPVNGVAPAVTPHPGPLPPGLGQLAWLEDLTVQRFTLVLHGGIPLEWLQPGAFPRLKRLALTVADMGAPLPHMPPGALPQLEQLRLQFDAPPTALPASWGSSPAVLPALQHLNLAAPASGQLPVSWNAGFRHLHELLIHCHAAAARPAAAAPLRLPPEWAASGAFPSLQLLTVSGCELAAPMPQAWLDGGFPSLSDLTLHDDCIMASLPAQIFRRHPMLRTLWLKSNITGTLPEEWGESQVTLLTLGGNQLTGPAFPPAWLRPGAMSHLKHLALEDNPGLSGSLPPNLSWPNLSSMAPFAGTLHELWIDRTAVDPTLPQCAARSLPTLHLTVPKAPPPPPFRRKPKPSAATASLAALLPLGVLVGAGALGRVLWQRKLQQQQQQCRGDRQLLLQMPRQPGSTAALPAGAGSESGASHAEGLTRQRLARMLRAELGAGPGSRMLSMLPLEALPKALAHGLGKPAAGRQAAAAGNGVVGAAAANSQQRKQRSQEADPLLPQRGAAGPGHTAVADADAAAPAAAASAAGMAVQPGPVEAEANAICQAGGGSSSSACRQWGLDSLSLQLSPHEVTFATDAAGQLVVLGGGACSMVYRGWLPGLEVAIKVVELLPGMSSQSTWGEISLLRRCVHPCIVPLFGVAIKGPLLLLAMRLMRGGSLHSALRDPAKRQLLRWEARGCRVALHVCEALHHLHGRLQVMHSDLKSSNVLLSEDLQGYVADLGVSQVLASTARTAAGCTTIYAAPEQLLGQRCTLAADMYCFGLLLVELTTQELIMRRGGLRLPQAPHDCPQGIVDLIEQCMSADPSRRPTAAQALPQLQPVDPG